MLDPVHREHGTYADGFAALVFALMAWRTGWLEWQEPCSRSLAIACRRPADSEFDHLALLLLAHLAQRKANSVDHETCSSEPEDRSAPFTIRNPKSAIPVLYRGRRLVSNNWIAMRALNYSLRAALTGSHEDAREAERLWGKVLRWQLPSGLFVDSPGGEATPITYHAKFCAVLALALSETSCCSEEMCSALARGLEALASLVSPTGMLVPYGRSRNALFGYAGAILAFRRGAVLLARPEYRHLAALLEARLACYQQPDGHVPCVLNEREREKHDWDVYVNNPDYNAYASALLLLSDASGEPSPTPRDEQPVVESIHSAFRIPHSAIQSPQSEIKEVGPLLIVRTPATYAAFVTTGQSVPFGTPFFCDHRYYGMQPLWIERDGRVLLEPDPYTWRGGEDRSSLVDPGANQWVPWMTRKDRRYAVRQYESVTVARAGEGVKLTAEGVPETYKPVPRWRRALGEVLFRVTGHPSPVFERSGVRGVRLRRCITWNPELCDLMTQTESVGTLPSGRILQQSSVTLPQVVGQA